MPSDDDTSLPGSGKKRGRPPKYADDAARRAARRNQVRAATRSWRQNCRAGEAVAARSLSDAERILTRVIDNMIDLAERVAAHPQHYPQGFDALLRVYADDARSAAAHLDYVLRRDSGLPGKTDPDAA